MSHVNNVDARAAAIRRLTIAVWALAVAVLLDAVLLGFGLMPWLLGDGDRAALADLPSPSPESSGLPADNGFRDLPIEQQIAAASVIVRTTRRIEADEVIVTVAEIIKRARDTTFYYDVGDELRRYPAGPHDRGSRPEGMIEFFVGQSGWPRYGISYDNDRIAVSGMPLDKLRELSAATK